MSSAASTSGSVNGRTSYTNGSAVHGDDSFDANGMTSPSSSSVPLNGFSQWVSLPSCRFFDSSFVDYPHRLPYQDPHNEEIVSHLYHSGFQTGVGTFYSTSTDDYNLDFSYQNYADTILVRHF